MFEPITFRDFLPEDRTRFLGLGRKFEPRTELMARVNAWLEEESIEVLNIETVLLPGLPEEDSTVSTEKLLQSTQWAQAIRVWYRES